MTKSHHVSIRARPYAALVEKIGHPTKGERGHLSRTVDALINRWLDQQEQKQDGN